MVRTTPWSRHDVTDAEFRASARSTVATAVLASVFVALVDAFPESIPVRSVFPY